MFEPLGEVIRLRRLQLGLTMDKVAKAAKVSRRQLSLLEDGRNVSLLFLMKIAKVLEIKELPIGDLRLLGTQPEVQTIVHAADVLQRVKQTLPGLETAVGQIREASASLEQMLDEILATGANAQEILESVRRVEQIPDDEKKAAAETVRSLGQDEPPARAERPEAGDAAADRQVNG